MNWPKVSHDMEKPQSWYLWTIADINNSTKDLARLEV